MIIGILSDTHSLNLPTAMLERFKTVDLIIHCGDICDAGTLKELKKIVPLKAVCGNMDDALLKKQLPTKIIVPCEGINIGVTHGHIGPAKDALSNAQALFKEDQVDVVMFGHSHHAIKEQRDGRLFFNPGSPNDVVRAKFFSYGIMTIAHGKIHAEIIKI